ncbi:hypothetical protein H632_c3575p0 [Helicosporidium sp. ATCC 50920]|nr:hypothetical protein H632_c3575p0 [Helicosporidium sp. ATCC 50920]|eukprot:KDD72288.1 hypothetical protein H632_c3575p0 [Helicosporidium sp. ATCC 50920]
MGQVKLRVDMACQGCAGAVRRVLEQLEGVESVDIDVAEKSVVVTGSASPDAVLAAASKAGKKTEFWQ